MVTSTSANLPELQWFQTEDKLGIVLAGHRVQDLKISTVESKKIAFSFVDPRKDEESQQFAAELEIKEGEIKTEPETYKDRKSGRDHILEFTKKESGISESAPFGNEIDCDFSRNQLFEEKDEENAAGGDMMGGLGGDMGNFNMADFQARMAEMQKNGSFPDMPGMDGLGDGEAPDFNDDDEEDDDVDLEAEASGVSEKKDEPVVSGESKEEPEAEVKN
ncbi:MAG: hypothetical protein MHMPM18_004049 [Marteilia pararefringens]